MPRIPLGRPSSAIQVRLLEALFWPRAVANCPDLGYFTNQLVNFIQTDASRKPLHRRSERAGWFFNPGFERPGKQ